MRGLWIGLFVALLSGTAVTTAAAQSRSAATSGSRSTPWTADARLRYTTDEAGLARYRMEPPARLAASSSDRRTGRALMIVGAAGIVTGVIVDESIVTIAGAGVGGYGLYLYLK
jgi:hypothetical protein